MNLLGWLPRLIAQPNPVQQKLAQLESQLATAQQRLQESITIAATPVSPLDRFVDGDRYLVPGGTRQDRQWGSNRPVLNQQWDLNQMRTNARLLLDANGFAIGGMDRLIDFVVGEGFKREITLRDAEPGATSDTEDPLIRQVTMLLDDWCKKYEWGHGEEDREAETFKRVSRDGEVFTRVDKDDESDSWMPWIRFVEPEHVYTPPDKSQMSEWSWGILTKEGDVETRLAYWVGDPKAQTQAGDPVDAADIFHHKVNTDRTIKRGISDFFPVFDTFESARKILRNMGEVAAIQAAIAWIRQHAATTTADQVQRMIDRTKNYDQTNMRPVFPQGPDNTQPVTFTEPGQVLDMSNGMQYLAGPSATGSPGFIQVLQATLRGAGARWGAPEFFSGDACLSEDSQMLTRRGWVGVHELTAKDEIGTVNPITHNLEFQRPLKVWQSHRTGPMVHLITSRFDLLVTPNHDVYISPLAPARPKWRKERADEVAAKGGVTFGCLSSVHWVDGSTPETITLPGLKPAAAEDVLNFLGIYVGDGSVTVETKRVTVGGVSKTRKLEYYDPILKRLGFKSCLGSDGRTCWYMDNQELHDWLIQNIGTESGNKRLPEMAWGLCVDGLAAMWNGLLESDGYRPKGCRTSTCYVTVSKKLADDVQILCLRLGFRASIRKNPPGEWGHQNSYKINVMPGKVQTLRTSNVRVVDEYDGLVWCVTVPNGLIVSRRNGKVAVSGNSNNNFASILVSGSPFERYAKRRQSAFSAYQERIFYRVLEYAEKADKVPPGTCGRINIRCIPPAVAIANRNEDEQIRSQQNQAGVLSKTTWQRQVNLDPKVEAENFRREKEQDQQGQGQQQGQQGDIGQGGMSALPQGGMMESYTPSQYELLSEGARSGLVKKMITNRLGDHQTVWIRPGDAHPPADVGQHATDDHAAPTPTEATKNAFATVFGKARELGNKAMNTKVGRVLKEAEHKLGIAAHKTRDVAVKAAEMRGLDEGQTKKLKASLAMADFFGGYVSGAAAGAVAGPLGAKVAMFMPSASAVYLAYSTAKDPVATWKAALQVVEESSIDPRHVASAFSKAWFATESAYHWVDALADLLKADPETSDWRHALFLAALAATGDPEHAIEFVSSQDTPEVCVGESWYTPEALELVAEAWSLSGLLKTKRTDKNGVSRYVYVRPGDDQKSGQPEASQQTDADAKTTKADQASREVTKPPPQPEAKPKPPIQLGGYKTYPEAKEVSEKLFGKSPSDQDFARLGCAVDGARVTVDGYVEGDSPRVQITSDYTGTDSNGNPALGLKSSRELYRGAKGELVCENYNFTNDSSITEKSGTELFRDQVETLRKLGVNQIVTVGSGSKQKASNPNGKSSGFNGYYTWPRLGYSGEMSDDQFQKLPADIRSAMGSSRDVRKLFDTVPGGPEAWKEHGDDIGLTFDLTPGSVNMVALEKYLTKRGLR